MLASRIRGVLIFFIVFCTLPCVLGYTPAGLQYSNWDGMEVCSPVAGLLPASEAEVVDAIRSAAKTGEQLKIVGAGHSFSGIQLTDGKLANPGGRVMSLDLLSGIIDVHFLDDGSGDAEVTAMAGTRLRDLNSALEARGLAFENLGACAAQSLAGAVATATHGTGRDLGSISTQLRGLRIIDAMGSTLDLRGDDPDTANLFAAARVGLGAMGVVVAATVRVVPLFKMRKTTFNLPLDEFLHKHDEFYQNYSRFQWSWVPYSGTATVMLREITDDAITGCWAEDDDKTFPSGMARAAASPPFKAAMTYNDTTECVDVSYKTLVDSNSAYPERTLYTEMEMFVPVENVLAAVTDFIAYQDSVRDAFEAMMAAAEDTTTALYSQVRYVKADDILLSPMRGRDVAVLSMIVEGDQNATGSAEAFELFCKDGLETICGGLGGLGSEYNGVPHWGKKNWATYSDLLPFYGTEAFGAFEALRSSLDPTGIFLNDYLRDRGVGREDVPSE